MSTLSGPVKSVYHVPHKAPHYVSYEVTGIPNPEQYLRLVTLEDMYKALNGNNRVVADVTLHELQHPKWGDNTDYTTAMQWLRDHRVHIKEVSHHKKITSRLHLTHDPRKHEELYLFIDASEQHWWGGGGTSC